LLCSCLSFLCSIYMVPPPRPFQPLRLEYKHLSHSCRFIATPPPLHCTDPSRHKKDFRGWGVTRTAAVVADAWMAHRDDKLSRKA
jgi:hypothetical protein